MKNLSKEDLVIIHSRVENRFKMAAGIREPGLVDSIVKRPDQILSGTEIFPDIYSKAAAIMEACIRWHPFADGNKRTALLAVEQYLTINGYFSFYPAHAVRFSVTIAATQGQDQETTNKLIRDIATWLKKYSTDKCDFPKLIEIVEGLNNEIKQLEKVYESDQKKAERTLHEWLAIDIYPEYEKETKEILLFIGEIYERGRQNARNFIEQFKKECP